MTDKFCYSFMTRSWTLVTRHHYNTLTRIGQLSGAIVKFAKKIQNIYHYWASNVRDWGSNTRWIVFVCYFFIKNVPHTHKQTCSSVATKYFFLCLMYLVINYTYIYIENANLVYWMAEISKDRRIIEMWVFVTFHGSQGLLKILSDDLGIQWTKLHSQCMVLIYLYSRWTF